jgi:hypothetical protein
METVKLRGIQEPNRVGRLLEAYIARCGLLPDGSYRVRDLRGLPMSVRAVITRATEAGQVWSCWERGPRVWLFICEMSLPQSRERGTPVLLVHRYGDDAELKDSGSWKFDPLGTWSRCAD